MVNLIFFILFSYLLGSTPFGKLIGKKYGVDIQKSGSGNIGATNTLRLLGWKLGAFVLVLDTVKGFIPVRLALQVLPFNQVLVIGLATVLAHIFPIWLKFKGGKGVPHLHGNGRGDHYVRIKVVVPKHLTNRQKELLEQFQRENSSKKSWF